MRVRLALLLSLISAPATAQTTLQLDDGSMEQLWSLTSPNAGPGDWVGVAYTPPFEHPFRVVSATMHYVDTFCCTGGICSDVGSHIGIRSGCCKSSAMDAQER